MNKRVTAIGLTAGLLAGAGAGLILEMSGSAGALSNATVVTVGTDDTSDTSATDDTVSSSTDTDRAAERTARLQSILQPLIDDGTITQAQADAVIAALQAAGPVGGPHGGGPGHGFGGGLDTVATVLGITADEVRTAVEGGQTIAELAVANGKTAQDVIDALVAEVETHFAEEVAAGEHTQAEADARIAEATTRITDFVNNTQTAGPGMGGPGMGGPGMHGHGPGDDGTDSGTDATTTTAAGA